MVKILTDVNFLMAKNTFTVDLGSIDKKVLSCLADFGH